MTDTLDIGDLTFDVRRRARRKHLGSTVECDGERVVSALVECPVERVEA